MGARVGETSGGGLLHYKGAAIHARSTNEGKGCHEKLAFKFRRRDRCGSTVACGFLPSPAGGSCERRSATDPQSGNQVTSERIRPRHAYTYQQIVADNWHAGVT
jgi:hypothetical protein